MRHITVNQLAELTHHLFNLWNKKREGLTCVSFPIRSLAFYQRLFTQNTHLINLNQFTFYPLVLTPRPRLFGKVAFQQAVS